MYVVGICMRQNLYVNCYFKLVFIAIINKISLELLVEKNILSLGILLTSLLQWRVCQFKRNIQLFQTNVVRYIKEINFLAWLSFNILTFSIYLITICMLWKVRRKSQNTKKAAIRRLRKICKILSFHNRFTISIFLYH